MQELADQTGLGRSTVREALKVLEAEGLLHMRYGRNGGPHVLGPDSQDLVRTVDVFVRRRKVLYATLLETREAIEPHCAAWAALRRTDEDLERLHGLHEQVVEAQHDIVGRLDANVRWHMAIVEAGHNEIISAFMTAISSAIRDSTSVETLNEEISGEGAPMLMAHTKVMRAIEAQDAEGARRAMQRHLDAFREATDRHQHPVELQIDSK
jgi:Transcriptional regulators